MSSKIYTINDVAMVCTIGIPAYSPYGYVVGADGTIYALTDRFFHGVIVAVLYPELAAEKQYPAPASPRDDLDVFAYQRFEHDTSRDLPILRVSVSLITDTILVSKGKIPATDEQIDAMQRIFKALGKTARDTLTGEEDDPTVGEYIEQLRQERVWAAQPDAERYKAVRPSGFVEGGAGDE
jgi:hypothetical protein